MMLLILLADLPLRFRFVSTVTILQQAIHPILVAAEGIDAVRGDSNPQRPPGSDANRSRAAVESLPKSWAIAGAFSLLTPRFKLAQYSGTHFSHA
jgi:hypothetical protein